MKKTLVLCGSLLLLAVYSCKKKPYYRPAPLPVEKKWVVTTVAGTGDPGFNNGNPATATFNLPTDVIITPGALYINDGLNYAIRKISGGQVSTFAGGTQGYVDANGMAARFGGPLSITVDGDGNLYTTDESDIRIRKITPAADVTTYAGSVPGFKDGDLNEAKFLFGNSVAADLQGNLYVSDIGNQRIRKVGINGKVTTLAGTGVFGFRDGNGDIAQFRFPGGIAVDVDGNVYVGDNSRIRKITPAGVVSTIAGGTEGIRDGVGNEAQFGAGLQDMVVDPQGNIYVLDLNRIRRVTPQGVVTTIAGNVFPGFRDGDGSEAKFNAPLGITIDAGGNLYVADMNNNRIRKISFQ